MVFLTKLGEILQYVTRLSSHLFVRQVPFDLRFSASSEVIHDVFMFLSYKLSIGLFSPFIRINPLFLSS